MRCILTGEQGNLPYRKVPSSGIWTWYGKSIDPYISTTLLTAQAESIEWFIEARLLCCRMIWRLAHPFPSTLPSASFVSFSVFLFVAGRAYWQERGTVAWDGFFDHSIVSRIQSKDFNFFSFWSNFGCIYRIRRVRQDFSTTYEDSIGSIF